MADRTQDAIDLATGQHFAEKMHDNGDGTFSPVEYGGTITANLATGENHLGSVGGSTFPTSDSFARPADTTPYTVGDCVSATTSDSGTTPLRALANCGRVNGGSGYFSKFRLETDQSTCVARFRIHLYSVAAPTDVVPGDNAAMTIRWNNRAQRLGSIDLPAMVTGVGSSTAARTADYSTRIAFVCAVADTSIYYRIECLDGFSPASSQNFYFEAACERN